MKAKIPLEQQIAEVGRELGLRRNVYPGMVARGRMTQGEADMHLARLDAAYSTLKWLQANRAWVVAATPGDPLPPAPADPA